MKANENHEIGNERAADVPDPLAALAAIVEAGRMSESSRARYCAEIAKAAIKRAEP